VFVCTRTSAITIHPVPRSSRCASRLTARKHMIRDNHKPKERYSTKIRRDRSSGGGPALGGYCRELRCTIPASVGGFGGALRGLYWCHLSHSHRTLFRRSRSGRLSLEPFPSGVSTLSPWYELPMAEFVDSLGIRAGQEPVPFFLRQGVHVKVQISACPTHY
jgi:hypothetical protein